MELYDDKHEWKWWLERWTNAQTVIKFKKKSNGSTNGAIIEVEDIDVEVNK